jgi:inorganic phosphate transporter, PiT family
LVAAGPDAVKFAGIVGKVLLPAVLSPIVAGLVALIATRLAYRITAHGAAGTVNRGFRLGQVVSSSMVALAHGTNDAQKTMGVITLALITAGALPSSAGPPFWVIVSAGLAIGLGTYAGGWRIIHTLGRRVSEIQTAQGFTSGTSTAVVILTSSHLGFPLSTTQVATGAVVGAGAGRGVASVHWGLAGQVAVGWLLTLPAAGLVGALAAWAAITGPVGTIIVAVVLVGISGGIYAVSRRRPVTPDNVNETPAAPPPANLVA